jgi:hypothetical protein
MAAAADGVYGAGPALRDLRLSSGPALRDECLDECVAAHVLGRGDRGAGVSAVSVVGCGGVERSFLAADLEMLDGAGPACGWDGRVVPDRVLGGSESCMSGDLDAFGSFDAFGLFAHLGPGDRWTRGAGMLTRDLDEDFDNRCGGCARGSGVVDGE